MTNTTSRAKYNKSHTIAGCCHLLHIHSESFHNDTFTTFSHTVDPLIPTSQPQQWTINSTVITTLAINGWAATFGTARRDLAGCGPTQSLIAVSKRLHKLTCVMYVKEKRAITSREVSVDESLCHYHLSTPQHAAPAEVRCVTTSSWQHNDRLLLTLSRQRNFNVNVNMLLLMVCGICIVNSYFQCQFLSTSL